MISGARSSRHLQTTTHTHCPTKVKHSVRPPHTHVQTSARRRASDRRLEPAIVSSTCCFVHSLSHLVGAEPEEFANRNSFSSVILQSRRCCSSLGTIPGIPPPPRLTPPHPPPTQRPPLCRSHPGLVPANATRLSSGFDARPLHVNASSVCVRVCVRGGRRRASEQCAHVCANADSSGIDLQPARLRRERAGWIVCQSSEKGITDTLI